jgi:hypothetical protein
MDHSEVGVDEMGVGPIIRIFAAAAIESTSDEREVKPSFALDRSSLMKDDDYGRSGREAERGLEDEEDGAESPESASNLTHPGSTMKFIV